ncbi:twin-arginine translocase TatA/TatE family subunit [Halomicronema sp. CCY15110]|uniref:Sec-independent protein translocase subunit TatA/TatB n=1 Tax=Halomicronema sp. CCY15110 TaxID=2767773 RepID=UPI00194F25FC|nr:twin-arginine translocase TatA/TatE family subunit [Halomicronema sp. CCY15110]
MFNIGWTEVILVLGVGLLIFGPKRIPELGQALGKTLRIVKDEINTTDVEETAYIEEEDEEPS